MDAEQEKRIAVYLKDERIRKLGRDECISGGNLNPTPEEEVTMGLLVELRGPRTSEQILADMGVKLPKQPLWARILNWFGIGK